MKKLLIGLFLVSTLNAYADSGDAKTCHVDDRVSDLSAVISDINEGKLQKNLQMNSETLIGLKPKVVLLLKDKYEIVKADCSTIKVIAGEPSESVDIDFTIFFNELVKAVSAKDDTRVKWLIASFKAAPMTAEKAVGSLLVPAPTSGQIADQLAQLLNIKKLSGIPIRVNDKNEFNDNFVLLSDVYRTLGGHIVGELPKIKIDAFRMWHQYSRDPQDFIKAATQSMGVMKYDISPLIAN